MSNVINWINNKLFHRNIKEDLHYKRRLLQCAKEQIRVETETQEQLEDSLLKFRDHLSNLKQRADELKHSRETALNDLENEKKAYDERGELDEQFERKYQNTERFLNETLLVQLETIEYKMRIYESKIENLQRQINEIGAIRERSIMNAEQLEHEIRELESLNVSENEVEDDNRMLVELSTGNIEISDENKASLSDINAITVVDMPQEENRDESV